MSWYHYLEVNWFPGIVTRKKIYFRETIPQNQFISGNHDQKITTKKNRENENIFKNILACESRDQVLLIPEKNQGSKISGYSPFKLGIKWIPGMKSSGCHIEVEFPDGDAKAAYPEVTEAKNSKSN